MNLLKSTGFLLKYLYLPNFLIVIVGCDFWIFSNPRKSFHAFSGIVGKNLGKRGIFTNEILAQKMRTVKSTLDEWEFS